MITSNDLNKRISEEKLISWGMIRQVKKEELIDKYIDKIPLPESSEIKTFTKEWCDVNRLHSKDLLNQWKLFNGFNEEQWTVFISRKCRWINWCSKNFQDQISHYFLERKTTLDKVKYSLLRVKNKNLADELYLRINEGESTFHEMAVNYSEGPEKRTGGLIGPVPLGSAHPQLANLLKISQKDQIWSPRKIDDWWVIIRLEKHEPISLDKKTSLQLAEELGDNLLKNNIENLFRKNLKNIY